MADVPNAPENLVVAGEVVHNFNILATAMHMATRSSAAAAVEPETTDL